MHKNETNGMFDTKVLYCNIPRNDTVLGSNRHSWDQTVQGPIAFELLSKKTDPEASFIIYLFVIQSSCCQTLEAH